MFSDISRYVTQESIACCVFRHVTDVAADQLHGIATIAAEQAVAVIRLRRRAIDDGNEVSGDDDSVLAFLRGILWDEGLLYNFHG